MSLRCPLTVLACVLAGASAGPAAEAVTNERYGIGGSTPRDLERLHERLHQGEISQVIQSALGAAQP